MKHYSLKPLHVVLRPSPRLALLLGSAGAGVGVLLALLPLPIELRAALVTLVLVATFYHILHDALRLLPYSLVALEIDATGQLRVQQHDGQSYAATVCGDSYVSAALTLLNVRLAGKRRRRSMVLLADAAEKEAGRRLRVWLRWSPHRHAGGDVGTS